MKFQSDPVFPARQMVHCPFQPLCCDQCKEKWDQLLGSLCTPYCKHSRLTTPGSLWIAYCKVFKLTHCHSCCYQNICVLIQRLTDQAHLTPSWLIHDLSYCHSLVKHTLQAVWRSYSTDSDFVFDEMYIFHIKSSKKLLYMYSECVYPYKMPVNAEKKTQQNRNKNATKTFGNDRQYDQHEIHCRSGCWHLSFSSHLSVLALSGRPY